MNKLASINYDILDFILAGDLQKVASVLGDLSPETRKATILDFNETQARPDSDFALITSHPNQGEIKKYAKYDKNSTELSAAFLADVADSLPEEILKTASTNLSKACREHSLPFPEKLASYVTSQDYISPKVNLNTINEVTYETKLASVNSGMHKLAYALPSLEKYPINTKEEIREANNYFIKFANSMSPAMALEYSQNLYKAAEEASVKVSPLIEKWASSNTSQLNDDFEFHVRSRVAASLEESSKEEYNQFLKTASQKDPKEVLSELFELDKKASLTRMWGNGLSNPIDAVFAKTVLTKTAEVSLSELQGLSSADLTPLVGSDAVAEIKGPEGEVIYASLPTPIKKEIKALLGR